MTLDEARALAVQRLVHPTEAATASLVVLVAILDRLDAAAAANPPPDEKPAKGRKVNT